MWNNAETNEYLLNLAVELEKERLNTLADNQAFQLWMVQSIGFLHACLHNSGMAGYKKPLDKNPVYDSAPERVRKLLGLEDKVEQKEMSDIDMFLLTATPSQKKEYYDSIKEKVNS